MNYHINWKDFDFISKKSIQQNQTHIQILVRFEPMPKQDKAKSLSDPKIVITKVNNQYYFIPKIVITNKFHIHK